MASYPRPLSFSQIYALRQQLADAYARRDQAAIEFLSKRMDEIQISCWRATLRKHAS